MEARAHVLYCRRDLSFGQHKNEANFVTAEYIKYPIQI